jgi:hypothetical protein
MNQAIMVFPYRFVLLLDALDVRIVDSTRLLLEPAEDENIFYQIDRKLSYSTES